MKFKISEQVAEKYPEVNIGVVIVKDADNSLYNEEIQELLRKTEEEMRKKIDIEKILEVPSVAKWREVYKSFGAKPSDTRNSAEAILRRVLKGGNLPKINCLVDLYNYISLKYTLTVGGEDIDKIEGDLVLDFANGDEEFIAIGSDENKPPMDGEVVYKDDKGVACRCWNWKEGDRTKLTDKTKNAVLVIENLIPGEESKFKEALDELKQLVEKYCNAKCEGVVLNKDNLEVEL